VNEQEKQQLFQMLSQGLMQYMAPTLQQFIARAAADGVKAAGGGGMNQPVVVNRAADEDSDDEVVQQRTTPAQLLGEIADYASITASYGKDLSDDMEDVKRELREIKKRLGRTRKTGG